MSNDPLEEGGDGPTTVARSCRMVLRVAACHPRASGPCPLPSLTLRVAVPWPLPSLTSSPIAAQLSLCLPEPKNCRHTASPSCLGSLGLLASQDLLTSAVDSTLLTLGV